MSYPPCSNLPQLAYRHTRDYKCREALHSHAFECWWLLSDRFLRAFVSALMVVYFEYDPTYLCTILSPLSLTKDVDLHIQCLLQVAVSRETDSNIQQQQHTHCRWMPCLKSMRDYTTTWSIENTTRSQVFDTLLATCNSYENNDSGQDVGTSVTRPKGVGYMY